MQGDEWIKTLADAGRVKFTYQELPGDGTFITDVLASLRAEAFGKGTDRLGDEVDARGQGSRLGVSAIKQRRNMLDGICEEAVEILRNSNVSAAAFAVLKKMTPIRQIEAAEHMHATGTFSVRFAQALLEVTRPELLVETSPKPKPTIEATSLAAQAMLEQETDLLIRELKAVEESYGTDMLTLSICAYIERLLSNPRVEKHLEKHHPDILRELRALLADVKPQKDKSSEAAA